MRIQHLIEEQQDPKKVFHKMIKDFLPIAMDVIGLKTLPDIKLVVSVPDTDQPTFGKFVNEENRIYLSIEDRHPLDILRTLAHELVHYKQGIEHELEADSGRTGSPEENEANMLGGIVMRYFNKAHPEYFDIEAIDVKENFADGKNPQDKGDAKRHGINTKASVSSLRKTAKQGGRKGQLAHWLANMKSGRAKKK